MSSLIIINQPQKWNFNIPGVEVSTPEEYLTNTKYFEAKNWKIFNLSKSYKYQSEGYYVSLLAMARGHKILPSISTIQDLKSQAVIKIINHDIDTLIQKSLSHIRDDKYTLSIYFGKNISKKNDKLSLQLFNLFKAPLLRAFFTFDSKLKKWILAHISPIPSSDVPEDHKEFLTEFALEFFTLRNFRTKKTKSSLKPFSLAILTNNEEKHPPSDVKAIKKFIQAAERNKFNVHLITKDDFSKIPQYDALFIRETTSVNHHTFRFSQRANAEGVVVIDDPESIIRCTNKVYLSELLLSNNVPTPTTKVLHKKNLDSLSKEINYPCILKEPDGAFSIGVKKVNNTQEFLDCAKLMMDKSDLIIVQEYAPTEFDWRVGIIDGKPLYVSKYFMAQGHWQIYDHNQTKNSTGDFVTISVIDSPQKLIQTALKAANLIGKGFYGVDLKQIGNQFYVIEVNDNPSIESGVEDAILKDELYEIIMGVFLQRVTSRKNYD
ncbi:MAG: RimK family protein [Leptospira sp.]|nr:RimK family protein [Leptospira sp.]